jgi:hypothetical protein
LEWTPLFATDGTPDQRGSKERSRGLPRATLRQLPQPAAGLHLAIAPRLHAGSDLERRFWPEPHRRRWLLADQHAGDIAGDTSHPAGAKELVRGVLAVLHHHDAPSAGCHLAPDRPSLR